MNTEESPLWILTFAFPSSDPKWELRNSIVGRPEQLATMFDLSKLPPGVQLLKGGKQVKRYIKQAAREEREFYAEQAFKKQAGGRN
jgi:hypothetical protein